MNRRASQLLVGAIVCSVFLLGCSAGGGSPASEGGEDGGFDWGSPIKDGIELPTASDDLADLLTDLDRSPLPFAAVVTDPLGAPLRAQASPAGTSIEDAEVDLVYDFGGRAIVAQHLTEYQATAAEYEQLADQRAGCATHADDPELEENFGEGAVSVTCPSGEGSLTRLDDGTLILAFDGEGTSAVMAMVEAKQLTPAAAKAFKEPMIEISIQSPDLGSAALMEQLGKILSSASGDAK